MTRSEILSLLLILLLVAVVIAMLPTAPRGHTAQPRVADWTKVHDDPQQRLTISWAGPPVAPSAHEGLWIETNLEKRFNVDFKPIFMDWNSFDKRRPLTFTAGEVPDVVWDRRPLNVRRSLHHGLIMELPYEVILKYAPTYVKYLNQFGRQAWLYAASDNKNYGIPTFAATDVYTPFSTWRMDWLRKAGINKVPDTIDEMHDAFLKIRASFKAAGKPEPYGMCPNLTWTVCFNDIFVSYRNLPFDLMLSDNAIVWGGIQPEAKQALTTMHQWYQEHLIDPDFATANQGTVPDDRFISGKTAYLYYRAFEEFDLSNQNSLYSRLKKLDPTAEMVPARPLIGPDGKRHGRVWGGPAHVIWFGPDVAKHPEKAIRVLRMFESYATDTQLFLESRLGKRGLHWDWSPQRGVYLLPPYDAPGADARNVINVSMMENAFGFFSPSAIPLSKTKPFLQAGKYEFMQEYCNPAWGMMNPIGKSDVVPGGRYMEDLWQFQMQNYVKFITGARPLSEFDQYTREFLKRGGATIVTGAQETHRDMQRIFRIVGAEDPIGGQQ